MALADGLADDITRAGWGEKLAPHLATTAAGAIKLITKGRLGKAGDIAAKQLTKAVIIQVCDAENLLHVIRHARGLWQKVAGDAESTAHSYCRAALAFAVQGKYSDAESWLAKAEEQKDDLARPNFIRGMMAGAQGNPGSAVARLTESLKGRAKPETKVRINEVLAQARELAAEV